MGFVHPIDWREQLTQFDPYLSAQGGYLRVRYSSEACAPLAFVKTISSRFEHAQPLRDSRFIRLDAENFKTRYLDDILDALARTIDFTLEIPSASTGPVNQMLVGSDNHSGGNQTINVSIDLTAEAFGLAALLDRRLDALAQAIKAFLAEGRLLIVITHMEFGVQNQFWSRLWQKCLSPLTSNGLLLVKMQDCSTGKPKLHPDEDNPLLEVELPTSWNQEMQKHAISDLADILVAQVAKDRSVALTKDDAVRRVAGVVYSHWEAIDHLHDLWSGVLMRLVEDVGQ